MRPSGLVLGRGRHVRPLLKCTALALSAVVVGCESHEGRCEGSACSDERISVSRTAVLDGAFGNGGRTETLDPTFGTGGIELTMFDEPFAMATTLVVEPDD